MTEETRQLQETVDLAALVLEWHDLAGPHTTHGHRQGVLLSALRAIATGRVDQTLVDQWDTALAQIRAGNLDGLDV